MRKIAILFLLVAVVAALSAFLTSEVVNRRTCPGTQSASSYEVLNERLDLSNAQKAVVRKIEQDFEARENVLRSALDEANRDLAQTIARENAYTPKVAAAVEHVHMCMGELQKASIAHLFELSEQLDAVQREKLMRYVGQALGNCHDE